MKRKRFLLIVALTCFAVAALALAGIISEINNCYAGQDTTSSMAKNAFYIKGDKAGGLTLYTRIKNPKGLVVLYGVSDVFINDKRTAKSKYITHSHKFLFEDRPVEQLPGGSINPMFPVWLSFMKVTMPQEPGKIVVLAKSPTNAPTRILGYIKVVSAEEWAICKRMRAAWDQRKKVNATQ
jgi:hypothetical protein